jgi:hypothetical protein
MHRSAINRPNCTPFAEAGIPVHANTSCGTVPGLNAISGILCPRHNTQIGNSVVEPIVVDVVNITGGPFAVHNRPNGPMGEHAMPEQGARAIAA